MPTEVGRIVVIVASKMGCVQAVALDTLNGASCRHATPPRVGSKAEVPSCLERDAWSAQRERCQTRVRRDLSLELAVSGGGDREETSIFRNLIILAESNISSCFTEKSLVIFRNFQGDDDDDD